MDNKMSLVVLYNLYKKYVSNNPDIVTDIEMIVTWSMYIVTGKMTRSPIIAELVYLLSRLITLLNDQIIQEAYGDGNQYYGLQEQIKLLLTILHCCGVFVELYVKKRWSNKGKWTAISMLQICNCFFSLILVYRYKEAPIPHPPIPALQRKLITEGKIINDDPNAFFTLRRSGRVLRRIDASPPIALRDWQPIQAKNDAFIDTEVRYLMRNAELLHVLKPLIHLAAMRVFGKSSWKQWLVALGLDLSSLQFFSDHIKYMSHEQKLEMSRRKFGLLLYLLRGPVYNSYSKVVIEKILEVASIKIPLMSYVCGPVSQYLSNWQDTYFYMWST